MSAALAGKVAVITGGSRGFGLAMARAYLEAGATVVIAARSAQGVEKAVAELRPVSGTVAGTACDVTVLAQVQALADFAVARFGRLDIWINNAGLAGPYGATVSIPTDAFTQVLHTNIGGVYHGSIVALRHFLAQGSGKLINILGHGERGPVAYQNPYASSKAWVRNFTLALAKEHQGSGVGVYALQPGMMVTDLLLQVDVVAGYEARLKSFGTIIQILARQPEEAARKAVWLASAATDGRTGLYVNASGTLKMLGGALRYGVRRLLGRLEPPPEVMLRVVPAAFKVQD